MPQVYDMGPTALLPLRRKACWGFFCPINPTASAGFEPVNLGTKGQHATPRAPKPLDFCCNNKKKKTHGYLMSLGVMAIIISFTTLANGNFGIRKFVLFWYFRISIRARTPGRNRLLRLVDDWKQNVVYTYNSKRSWVSLILSNALH